MGSQPRAPARFCATQSCCNTGSSRHSNAANLATLILLNDNDTDGALVLLARIQPGVVHLPRQPRLGLPPSTIERAFLQVQDGGSSFFYKAPRRPLQ